MLSENELWIKIGTNEQITLEDLGIPSWRRDCNGFEYELSNLFCRSGIAYRHKDGMRWANGDWFTKRQCKVYGFECGVMNDR